MPNTKEARRTRAQVISEQQNKRYEEYKKKQLADPEFRRTYEEGLEELRLGVSIAVLREQVGLTQTQLAAMLHTSPSVISRVENGENVELKTLQRIAQALNAKLKIELVQGSTISSGP